MSVVLFIYDSISAEQYLNEPIDYVTTDPQDREHSLTSQFNPITSLDSNIDTIHIPSVNEPTVRCRIDDCMHNIPLVKSSIRQHLLAVHSYEAYRHGTSVHCRWEDCRCTKTRCSNRDLGHSVHAQDITEHVWHAHLNFHEICSKCGDARWVHPYARSRHESKCTGPKPARCKRCLIEFPSIVALEAHIMLYQCFGVNRSV
jgi:hypothetical protein